VFAIYQNFQNKLEQSERQSSFTRSRPELDGIHKTFEYVRYISQKDQKLVDTRAKTEIKINQELSHTIFGVELRKLP
jgi:hypothetical protein